MDKRKKREIEKLMENVMSIFFFRDMQSVKVCHGYSSGSQLFTFPNCDLSTPLRCSHLYPSCLIYESVKAS